MKTPLIAGIAAVVAATSIGMGGLASAADKAITLSIDGQAQQMHVWGSTVADVLDSQDLTLGARDQVSPALTEAISDGSIIEVNFARPLTVLSEGDAETHWTRATTLSAALPELGLHDPEVRLSVSRSTPLGREGLTFAASTPKNIEIVLAEGSRKVTSTASDVNSVLFDNGIIVDADDRVSPELGTRLSDDMLITVNFVDVREVTETEPIDFKTVESDDADLLQGASEVTREGKRGEKSVTYEITYVDGKEQSRKLLDEQVTTKAVDELRNVGTRPAPADYSGSHAEWLAAAGIDPADWNAAEILITRESTWNPNAVNPSSGACGLVQALPCSKLGPNWNDPIVALKWGDNYVKQRYGGWQGALSHSYANGWY
ncbi:MAG: G5 domain-containing protein [Brooklawnia sp.]|jgi:uncharacterized protein YabE (DUF348 family)